MILIFLSLLRVKTYQPFRFKQFNLHHSNSAMKVGTDGVLLGAWTTLGRGMKVLDIGTGTGLISLMLAQRYPEAKVTGIEINPEAAKDAIQNYKESPFGERLQFISGNVLSYDFTTEFDHVVSNPPYFSGDLQPTNQDRAQARHDGTLDFTSILHVARKVLTANGTISLIIPFDRLSDLIYLAENLDFFPSRITSVKGRKELPTKRILIELNHEQTIIQKDELIIEVGRHQYTNAYISLTKDFYLNM